MLQHNISLKPYNTFGFEVNAGIFYNLQNTEQLKSLWKTTLIPQTNTLILGGGSNILFTMDYWGLVLLNRIPGKEIIKQTNEFVWVKIGSGEIWHETVLWAVEQGFGGIENLSLIPGTVGAAPIQNIGAYGVELESVFEELEAFDLIHGKITKLNARLFGNPLHDSVNFQCLRMLGNGITQHNRVFDVRRFRCHQVFGNRTGGV